MEFPRPLAGIATYCDFLPLIIRENHRIFNWFDGYAMKARILTTLLLFLWMVSCKPLPDTTVIEEWQPLFNGQDLSGWDIKIAGQPLNDNYKNTFRVDSGMIRVKYDEYDSFRGKFGHLYYSKPLSYFKLRLQYRFVGTQIPGAPGWGALNSGVMIHSQSAESVTIDQNFPVSLEAQFLAAPVGEERTTGNICTPGTLVHMGDSLRKEHCINSVSKSYPVGRWVNALIEVYGDSLVRHIIEGDTVLTYTRPMIGGGFVSPDHDWKAARIDNAQYWIDRQNTPLGVGHIALQAESQPIDFRNIELLNLAGCTDPKHKNYRAWYVKSDGSCSY